MDQIRPGLQDRLKGQRGMLAVVLNGGTFQVGDPVRVEP
jgi:MOSC domain-containing protein YiiM